NSPSFLRGGLSPGPIFKGSFCGSDRAVHVIRVRVRNLRNHVFGGRVIDSESLLRTALHPLAIDVHLISAYLSLYSGWHDYLLHCSGGERCPHLPGRAKPGLISIQSRFLASCSPFGNSNYSAPGRHGSGARAKDHFATGLRFFAQADPVPRSRARPFFSRTQRKRTPPGRQRISCHRPSRFRTPEETSPGVREKTQAQFPSSW